MSMLTDESNANTSTSIESACLPIGCAVSAKYRGAFCSAQVKTVDRQVKLKVTLRDSGETVIISEEQILHPVPLRIGTTVQLHASNASHSGSGTSTLTDHHQKQQGTIKQIYDNSVYTVVFNDGDEKSLRRSSLCLRGIRLYQTKIGQQKRLEEIHTSPAVPEDQNDITSIVVVRRQQQAFPALILKRKSLPDYMWVRSFLDGREYIVHKRDDVETYKNNSEIQSLCCLTSKQATKACEKFIKYNEIPSVWQKKQYSNEQKGGNDLNTIGSDADDSDEESTEEKDSFVAQLFTFMDDRGTPINNIPKIHSYDLDLHRLFKVVRMLGGYNKVTKNDQWSRVYIKMGLPDEASTKNARAIENAYKKYLFAYEDLLKKLGTGNAPNAYFGGRTGMNNESRRSLIRVRQQSEEKKTISIKQQKRFTIDSKATKNPPPHRKTITIKPSLSTSESDTSDNETISNSPRMKNAQPSNSKKLPSSIKKPPLTPDENKKTTGSDSRSTSTSVRKSKSTSEPDNTMKPVIKIPKISYEMLMESTLTSEKSSKKQTSNKASKSKTDSPLIKQSPIHDLTPLPVTPISPSPPPSITDESPSINENFQTVIPPSITNQPSNSTDLLPSNNSIKGSDENSNSSQKNKDEFLPSKRSRSSEDYTRLTYENISINDILLVQSDLNEKKRYSAKCLAKNKTKKELLIHYQGLDSKCDEWIDIDRVIRREDEELLETIYKRTSTEEKKSNDLDIGIWTSLFNEDISSSTDQPKSSSNSTNNRLAINTDCTSDSLLHSLPVKEENIDNSFSILFEPHAIPSSPPDNRRTSIRQQKRRTFPTPKDTSMSPKKRQRLDFENNSNFQTDSINNSDNNSPPLESPESKRCRLGGKRNAKRTVNQTDNESEELQSNSPINITLRRQLEEMFKHRSSRYNFLDLDYNLTSDQRLVDLKDRMRRCQTVFFNLKRALIKIEKQRQLFLRRQKPLIIQPSTNDLLLPSTCT